MFGRNVRVLGGIALALIVAGCGDDPDDRRSTHLSVSTSTTAASSATTSLAPAPASTPAPTTTSTGGERVLPAGVEVFVEFPRYLQAARRLETAFDNRSDTPIMVTDVVLRSPLFGPAAPDTRPSLVEPGRRRDLQMGLGEAVCPPPAGPTAVEVTAEFDGVARRGLVPVDPAPLEQISADECGRELVLERVDVGYAPEFTATAGGVDAAIELRRRSGDADVALTATRGSVLIELSPQSAATPLGGLAPGQETTSIPVRLRVIRCDPHAVIESKKTFQLAVWIALDGGDEHRVVVPPEGALRAALEQQIEQCLLAQFPSG